MAGGNMHVRLSNGSNMGGANSLEVIDANSVSSGNMTVERKFTDSSGKSQKLFFTQSGAKAFDKSLEEVKNAGGMGKVTVGEDSYKIIEYLKSLLFTTQPEKHVGKV